MTALEPRSGYTLPVFACAVALAALRYLRSNIPPFQTVSIDLIEPAQIAEIPIEQVALLKTNVALAIARSDPGDNLDLTQHTPVWAMVELVAGEVADETNGGAVDDPDRAITICGGEGIGHHKADGAPAIYAYAQKLLRQNLSRELLPGEKITVTLILPEGRQLAARTSNEAFGVVEGLSLLGTSGISQPLSAPGQLEVFREELLAKQNRFDCLVFCIGENGLHLAQKLGIHPERLVKTANWLGPLLVEAGFQGVQSILLFGYHGKLMKLAGGIFHTHHYLADGRREILTAYCARVGVPSSVCAEIFACPTAEDGLQRLRILDAETGSHWVEQVYGAIATQIDQRSSDYIFTHSQRRPAIGSILFARDRTPIAKSEMADTLFPQVC